MQATKKSDTIDYLKAFAAILVVTHHAVAYSGVDTASGGWQLLLLLIISVHVPLFFVVAGYLCHRQPLKPYFQKKLMRVLLPFFTFSSLKLLYSALISDAFAHAPSLPVQLFDAFVLGGLYWFPYAILLCYALATLFWKDGRQWLSVAVLVGLIAVNVAIDLPEVSALSYFQIGNALCCFCFFLTGMLIRRCQQTLCGIFAKYKYIVLLFCLLVVVGLSSLLYSGSVRYCFAVKLPLALALMVVLYALASILPENLRLLNTVGRYSLQIMFLDSFFKVVLFAALGQLPAAEPVRIVICVAAGVLLGCVSCKVMERVPVVRRLFGL